MSMNAMFQTILVPVDFSPYAKAALYYAARIAERFGSSVLVLHVIAKEIETGMVCRHVGPRRTPLLGSEVAPMVVPAEVRDTVSINLREQAQTALQRFVASRPVARPLDLRVEVGHPVEQILDLSTRDHVDLIVMGTHGRTGLAHAVLGSVAERVVRLAPCPVLTVKKEEEG
jgi:nucleotide-binding universal stress UspA family protein